MKRIKSRGVKNQSKIKVYEHLLLWYMNSTKKLGIQWGVSRIDKIKRKREMMFGGGREEGLII